MTELRGMPYQYRRYWQTPAEVDSAQASDCKGKAVALYARMRSYGMKNVRVVIGKHHIYDSATHAWLEWETQQGNYVLDPTFNEMPIKTAELSPMTYMPLYAYDAEHKYRATHAGFVVPPTRVATGNYGNHVYTPANAGSTLAQPTFNGFGSAQPSSVTTRYAAVGSQHSQPTYQRSWSNAQNSSPTVQGIRRPGTVTTSNVKYVIPAHPITTHEQLPLNTQHYSTSNAARLRQTRNAVVSPKM